MSKTKINLGTRGVVEVVDGGVVDLETVDYRLLDGERVTNELAEQLADEAEKRGAVGRPYLDPKGESSVHVAFRVPREVSDRLDRAAQRKGVRRSDALREALDAYLAAS